MSLFKKDIYKNLRPKKTNTFMGMNLPDFPSIKDIEYKDALIYPRFVFKDEEEKPIFETSDYKEISSILGNTTLKTESIFNYKHRQYKISEISVEVLDIVIDYSNGHTEYYIGKPIPFHLEIRVKVKHTNLFEIANENAIKCAELIEKGNLTTIEELRLIEYKSEAETCFQKLVNNIDDIPEIYFNYGLFKYTFELNEEAINLIKKAIKIAPTNAQIIFELGCIYGEIDDAELEYKYVKMASDLNLEEAKEYLIDNFEN
ncbi:MAG: hypothetical protein IPK18_12405 [Sphingobacteriales bacterium]|nr:MAG: hypothetical protein IPK18_12405 [Sphingobacteriales bacterium]